MDIQDDYIEDPYNSIRAIITDTPPKSEDEKTLHLIALNLVDIVERFDKRLELIGLYLKRMSKRE